MSWDHVRQIAFWLLVSVVVSLSARVVWKLME